jgi:hypothetical protein
MRKKKNDCSHVHILIMSFQLSFAANTCIPLFIALNSQTEGVSLTHTSIIVQLVRTLYVHDFTPTRRGMSFHDVMAEGVFWPENAGSTAASSSSGSSASSGTTRVLYGELPLRKKLTPSFTFSKLSIQASRISRLSFARNRPSFIVIILCTSFRTTNSPAFLFFFF